MLSWETKIDEVGRIQSLSEEPCKVCSEKTKATMSVQQSVFFVLWMPIFPTSRITYRICPKCNARLKLKPTDPDLEWVNRQIPKKSSFKHYWGLLVIGALVAIIIYGFNQLLPDFFK